MKKRLLCAVMAGVIAVGGMGTVKTCAAEVKNAVEDEIVSPTLYVINAAGANLVISGSTASMTTTVTTASSCDIKITMRLKKKSGTSWTTVKTWTKSANNTGYLTMAKEYTVSSGTYRVYSTITAGGEEIVRTSPIKTK